MCTLGKRKSNSDIFYTDKELLELDEKGMPDSDEKLSEITSDIFRKYHEEVVTCAVCYQFTNISITKLLSVGQFPKKMYTLLKAPYGIGKSNDKLHPSLIKQYDVSEMFPGQLQFKNVLLSPNCVLRHLTRCASPENCRCIPKIYCCDENHRSCL
jgi:hypothetical protein